MPETPRDTAVAIVGMAGVFPGAADVGAYWSNIVGGVDAIAEVPAGRWDPVYFDPTSSAPDRFYCKRGGFVDHEATFDPIEFGIMPVTATGAEPDQLLVLRVAARALADVTSRAHDGARTGVILGRGGYLTPGMARLADRVRGAQQLVTTLAELLPDLDRSTLDRIRGAFQAKLGDPGPDAAIGLVPNLAASRIANRLDLRGPAYTVDAACASSLIAIDHACRELADRRCDLVLAGGVHVCHDVTFWSVFTQLGALSRDQAIRPFDRRADGILIGEGAGIVALRRLADAERDGDRIYAVIRGTGVSSDGREASAMRPRLEGQLAALDQAWRGIDRDTVGLVEAHGTGTPTGDEVELQALAQFFGAAPADRARPGLGSVKSMIGHAMPAAGVAGLIKAALAVHHGVLPPTLHCEEPHPELGRGRFRAIAAAEPWTGATRTAGVSAFGFGGINAHVVLDAHASSLPAPRRRASAAPITTSRLEVDDDPQTRILAIAAPTVAALLTALDAAPDGRTTIIDGPGPCRLALVDPTAERRALARKVVERGKAWRGKHDLWFAPVGLADRGGTLAFLFPGIEIAFAPKVADVARHLGLPLPDALAAAPTAGAATARDLERQGLGVFELGRLLHVALAQVGVRPDAIAGHSIGEWTGMAASELIPPGTVDEFVAGLPPGSLEVPDVVFAACGCGADGAALAIADLDQIAVSHDNCPHQSILCGRKDRIATAVARLTARGVLCQELSFKSGFHSPLLAEHLALHHHHLATLELGTARVPLWSATTCAPYPSDPDAIRAVAIDHLVQPVRFRELTLRLHESGVRAFVQLGVGSLTGFVGDTLRGVEHLAIAASSSTHSGLSQLARVVAALFADGFATALAGEVAPTAPKPARAPMSLALGAPLVRLGDAIGPLRMHHAAPAAHAFAPSFPNTDDPIVAELLSTLAEAAAAGQAVVDAYRTRPAPVAAPAPAAALPPPPTAISIRRHISVETDPWLLGHCFYRQPAGWPAVSDLYPVVPMTMTLGMMREAARALVPSLTPIAIEDIRAYRWLAVAPAVDVELRVKRRAETDAGGDVLVDVEVPGYSRATVRMSATVPPAPAPALPPLTNARPAPLTAAQMYDDRWMFHGPAYQGVTDLGPMGDDGVDGAILALPAPGALLDCAGQLMGWWVMQTEKADRLAMPVRLEKVELFGPEPGPGTRTTCRVRMRAVTPQDVRADLEVIVGDRVWARITSWEDRRFDSDDPVWDILMYPERHVLAEPRGTANDAPGYHRVVEHWRGAASRELMMRRYLGEPERAAHEALGPRRRRAWLLGRIAVKDAVRAHAWAANPDLPIFPVEVTVANDADGRPILTGRFADLRVSLAHKDDVAVARVTDAARRPGIDIERIEARAETFATTAFRPAEIALGGDRPRDAWLTTMWTAKEALAKARGTGLGDPRRFTVEAVDGDRLIVDGHPVFTHREGDHVIAWTDLSTDEPRP